MESSSGSDLRGRRIAITGASSGIGEATAVACARAGADVALAARREERLQAVADRISGDGARAFFRATDITSEDEARAFVEEAAAELGGLDGLVNNAGVMLLGPVVDAPTDEWRRMIEVNLLGVLYCTHAALPMLLDAQHGDIVNVSSVGGRTASSGSAVYNLTKWGLGAFSEALRQEVTARGVRVSVVEPGVVATELASHNRPEVLEASRERFAGVTRLQAQDIARAIVFTLAQPAEMSINEVLIRPSSQTF